MACNKHKRREGGEVVPVLNGLARDVATEAKKLCGESSVGFRFISGHQGKSKVKMDSSRPGELHVIVCDNQHGKGVVVVKTPNVGTVARDLSQRLRRQGITVV